MTCEEFTRRALEAVKAEDAKREKEMRDHQLKCAKEGYAYLKGKLPLLRSVEGIFTMCGYVFRVGAYANCLGHVHYDLISDISYVSVYDEASFGRFLNDVESRKGKSVTKGFWASLFS